MRTIGTNCCEARWTGLRTCHCATCHETFSGLGAFDAHRYGSFSDSGARTIDKKTGLPQGKRRCLPPESVGLVLADRAYRCWGTQRKGKP